MARPLDEALEEARAATAAFFAALPRDARVVVFCHFDADGLTAGAVFGRALPRLGFADVRVVHSGRAESAFSEAARARLAALAPAALVVTDLGVRPTAVLPGVPTLFVDHHRPEGAPPGAVVVSGYDWDPIPNSSWIAWELMRPLTDVDDLAWIAAVGTLSDLGDHAPWDPLPALKKRHTAKALKEAVALVNAARRAPAFDVARPLRLLLEADDPRAFGGDAALRAYREEVGAAMREARKAAPKFSKTRPFALVRVHSGCQVHPLIAQQWRTRLPKYAVIGANTGYLPGVVAFSARTARTDLVLPAIFRATGIADPEGRFGHGHDQASGGHLPPALFDRLLDALGFEPSAHVRAPDAA